MGQPLELAGSYLKTEEGNEAHYYGGGGVAYASTALACAGVPLAVRKGKTVGVWENGKVVEYMWHTDTSNTGLVKKSVDVNKTTYIRLITADEQPTDELFPTERAVAAFLNAFGGTTNFPSFPGGQFDITGVAAGGVSAKPVNGRYNNIYNFVGNGDHAMNFDILTDYYEDNNSGGFLASGVFIYITNNCNQNITVNMPGTYWDGIKSKSLTVRPGLFLMILKYNQNNDPAEPAVVRSFFKTVLFAQSFTNTNYNSSYDF